MQQSKTIVDKRLPARVTCCCIPPFQCTQWVR